jgi:hypothetical protein
MKNFKILAIVALAAAALALSSSARAQTTESPMVVGQTPAKHVWMKAEVVHADANSIIVREEGNGMMVHTFTFTPQLKSKMQRIFDAGGYQNGDHVRIRFEQGQTVALDVRGRPSL